MLSVCPSVTLRYVFHIGWNSSKIISRPNSLRPLLPGWPQHGPSGATGTPQNCGGIGVGSLGSEKKPAVSPKRCKIGPRLLLRTNRKSYTRFRLVPKSVTLGELERRIQRLHKVFEVLTIISGTGKATDFKFGLYIHKVHPKKCPLKILEKK